MRAERRVLNRVLLASLAATVVAAGGCAPGPPGAGEPVSGEPAAEGRHWTCRPLDPAGAGRIAGPTESWTVEGGNMLSVHRTGEPDADPPGSPTRDGAMTKALASAAVAALDLLEQRGVSFEADKRLAIVDEVVDAAARGTRPAFPRVTVADRSWDECVSVEDDPRAPADTSWLAAVVVEYPIGLLRGDVNNVLWERSRAANEAEVLEASAEEHLTAGRWHDGLLDAARITAVVAATGVQLPREETAPPAAGGGAGQSPDDRLRGAILWSWAAAEAVAPLHARPAGGVDVIEAGASACTSIQFQLTYEWNGRVIPAVGVPVRFDMPGASAVLRAEPLTDGSGAATCRILSAYGPPSEYELTVSVDSAAVHAAMTGALAPGAGTGPRADAWPRRNAVLAGHTVHLVTGAHAISVCAAFDQRDGSDAAQVTAGFMRRMERDGFRAGECDPDVDVVITGEFSLVGSDEHGLWTAQVTLEASAFDQRTASGLGATRVVATQTADAEAGEKSRREAEVLALKEAGRLLAVYFGPRLLASGR